MKKAIGWIVGLVFMASGVGCVTYARQIMARYYWYTWRPPYTEYAAQIVMIKAIGEIFLTVGIICLVLKVFQAWYVNKHTKEITPLVQRGGAVQCSNCGLTLSADVKNCPRCGSQVSVSSISNASRANSAGVSTNELPVRMAAGNTEHFCSNCGNKVSPSAVFCPDCGHKIEK